MLTTLVLATVLGAPRPAMQAPSTGWERVGSGVSCRDTGRTRVYGTFVAYGGWRATESGVRAWTLGVYQAALARRGIRYLCAVQGPATVDYAGREIGNRPLADWLLAHQRGLVIVAAHSSGSFVAHELFGELESLGAAGQGLLRRTVYFDLDGGEAALTPAIVGQLRRAYFVFAEDSTTGTRSTNAAAMIDLGTRYASSGGVLAVSAAPSGCGPREAGCLHDLLATAHRTMLAYLAAPWNAPVGRQPTP